jgi:prephenate dehydratase
VRLRVAFQGERGAFSEEAALKLLGQEIELVPRRTFADLYRSIEEGLAELALAPVQNSIAGVVQPSVDLLQESDLAVIDQIEIHIAQNLIGCNGATFSDVATAISHPVALAQCRQFFLNNPSIKQQEADDTAGSVAEIMRRGDKRLAAVAGRHAADVYGAVILQENIQDIANNYTRFVLLSANGSKQSFSTKEN